MSEPGFSMRSDNPDRIGSFRSDLTDALRPRPEKLIGLSRVDSHRSDVGSTPFPDALLQKQPFTQERPLEPSVGPSLDPERGQQSFEQALEVLEQQFLVETYDLQPGDPVWLYRHGAQLHEKLAGFARLLAVHIEAVSVAISRNNSPATVELVYRHLAHSQLFQRVFCQRRIGVALQKLQKAAWPVGMARAGTTPPPGIVPVEDLPGSGGQSNR